MEVASGDPSKSAMAVSVAKKMPLSASQRDGAGELRKQPARPTERRRQPHIQAVVEDENEEEHNGTLRFRHSSDPKTGEVWTIYFQCKGKDPEYEFVDVHLDKADVTYFNLACFKEQLGYGPRDFMYYKMRCGTDVAKLQAMGYTRDADTVLRMNEAEKEIRLVLSKEEEHEKHVAITPIKRPREKEDSDDSSKLEDIDAYKLWLKKLQSKDPDNDLRDAFRDETIETYKEWLRHTGHRRHMLSLLEENTNDDDITQGEQNDRPSHARKPINLGDGESSKKHGRGCLKGLTVTNKRIRNRTQKLKIEFNPNPRLGGPIGENRRSFVDEVVTFTRKKIPVIGVKTWKGVDPIVKKSIADDILLNWDLQNVDEPKEKIWAIAKERYKGWRAAFSATYRAYRTDAERMKHKPEDLDNVEWYYLLQYFGSESFQKKSTKNTENRKKQKTQHLMESKPFSQISYDQRDPTTGEEPADLDLWMATHTKGGDWSNPDTKEVYDNACIKIYEAGIMKDKVLTVEEENAIFQKNYKETTGTKTYRCHGLGYLAKYPTRTALLNEREENLARHSAAAIKHQEEVEDLKQKLANEVAARERDKEESIRQMQDLREELRLQVALLKASTGTTTCLQPPNSATVGMNDITPPRIEDEEQEVQPASVMTILKEVDPPTTHTTANTTLTRNLFSANTSNLATGLNSSLQPIWPSAKTRSQKKRLQESVESPNN